MVLKIQNAGLQYTMIGLRCIIFQQISGTDNQGEEVI